MGKMRILFFGCGGGRLNVLKQFFSTAGFMVDCSKKIYVDPGPNVTAQFKKFRKKFRVDITDIEGIFVSHAHLDHMNDLEVVIEGMTDFATKRKGFLIGDESIFGGGIFSLISNFLKKIKKIGEKREKSGIEEEIEEAEIIHPTFSEYHRNLVEKIYKIKEGKKVEIDNLTFYGTRTAHDISATGFVLEEKSENLRLGYTSDTEFFDGIEKYYKNCDAIIVNVLRIDKEWRGHFCIEDVVKFLNLTRPRYAILTRFGGQFVNANKLELKKKIEQETNVETIFSYDGMEFLLEK